VSHSETDRLLAEQRRYYAARAPEYDQWWERRGRYDRGEDENRIWLSEVASLQQLVDAAALTDDVLELAGGTGNWTVRLAKTATRLTVLDASLEMIDRNRRRIREVATDCPVEYRKTDLFAWQPQREYDVVFFGFWLSHVPDDALDAFLKQAIAAVRPGGKLVIVDSRRQALSSSSDQPPPTEGVDRSDRVLNNGSRFEIVKRYFTPNELRSQLTPLGFDVTAGVTDTHFIHCVAVKQATST
jgi:demethylmenaquinone methyltransferase/2-methoxy-6-polyprenyl-1,4-benzoquinol methylase